MFIQQLFINIVGVECITVLCSDRKYSGGAATTHCHPTVPYRGNGEIVIHQYVCHMWLLNIDQICHLPSQGEVLDDQETVCLLREHFGGTHIYDSIH